VERTVAGGRFLQIRTYWIAAIAHFSYWQNEMKRFLFGFCAGSTLMLAGLLVFHVLTRKDPAPSKQQVEQATQITDSFSKVKAQPLSLEQFSAAVEKVAATNLNQLAENERRKLLACISQFYSCYSSGEFDDFKRFRRILTRRTVWHS